MVVLAGRLWRAFAKSSISLLILIVLAIFTWTQDPLASLCVAESNYFCIRVSEKQLEDDSTVMVLALDRLVHSYSRPEDPTYLHYGYQHVFASVAEMIANKKPDFSSLFIGGGGYELPRYLDAVHPQSSIDVIEIDPEVTATAHRYLGLDASNRVITHNRDARMALPEESDGHYDLVIGDAFNDLSVPYHLTTTEFNQEVKRTLSAGGVYAVNIVDAPSPGRFLRAFVYTLQQSFDHVSLVPLSKDLGYENRTTTIVLASDRPIGQEDFDAANNRLGAEEDGKLISADDLETWMGLGQSVLLTDNYAPIDNYLAPLFLKKS